MKIVIINEHKYDSGDKAYHAYVFKAGKPSEAWGKTEKQALQFLADNVCDKCKFIGVNCSCASRDESPKTHSLGTETSERQKIGLSDIDRAIESL